MWFVERTLVLVPPNSRLEASTANGVDGLSTPSRNSKVNGISLSPLARKTSAADPSRNKKAAARVPRTIALGLYNDIMPPQGRGALHYRHQNGKRSAVLQPRQDSNMVPRSFDPGRLPLRQAPLPSLEIDGFKISYCLQQTFQYLLEISFPTERYATDQG